MRDKWSGFTFLYVRAESERGMREKEKKLKRVHWMERRERVSEKEKSE